MREASAAGRRGTLPVVSLALGLLLGLAACGQAGGGAQGTLAGDVVAGPTCPVEQIDNPCPPKPVPNRQVTIATPSGATAATTTTDVNGHFSLQIAPGSYIVHVKAGPGMLGVSQVTPGDVTVRANQTSTLRIELDTGIR